MLTKFKKESSTRRTIAISYCVVLLFPIVFGVLLHSLAIHIVSEESQQAQTQMLDHMEETINASFESMNSVMDAMLVDQNVTSLMKRERGDFDSDDYWRMKNIQDRLRFVLLSNNYVEDILLYFHASDTVLSANSSFQAVSAAEGSLNILGMSVDEFEQRVARDNGNLRFFNAETGTKTPVVIRSNASSTVNGTPSLTFLVRMKKTALYQAMRTDDTQTFLFDEENRYLTAGNNPENGEAVLLAAQNGEDYGSYHLLLHPGALLSVRFVRLIPKAIYVQDVAKMQLVLGMYILICLAVGIPLAAHMIQRSYNPIKQIVSILPQVSSSQDADDFTRIEQSVNELIRRNISNENKIDKQADAMKSYLMHKIIQDGEGFRNAFLNGCREFGVQFEYANFLIAAVDIEDGSNLFFENPEAVNQQMSHLAFFAVSNMWSELLGGHFPFLIAEHDGLLLALINVDERLDKEHVLREINHCSEVIFDRMKNDFRAEVSISISGICEGYDGIGRCYDEIQKILYLRDCEKAPSVLLYRDIQLDEKQAQMEREAIEAIRSHEYDRACHLLKPQPEAEKTTKGTEIASEESEEPIAAMREYIDTHYADQNLTIAAIATHFDLSPSYFSLYFKRHMNVSPLDYMNLKRVEKVKELLQTDLPLKTIAAQVGYCDTRPMIRFFKRSVGVTPSEYREQTEK